MPRWLKSLPPYRVTIFGMFWGTGGGGMFREVFAPNQSRHVAFLVGMLVGGAAGLMIDLWRQRPDEG